MRPGLVAGFTCFQSSSVLRRTIVFMIWPRKAHYFLLLKVKLYFYFPTNIVSGELFCFVFLS